MQAKDARPWAPTSGLSYDRVNKFYRMIQGEAYDVRRYGVRKGLRASDSAADRCDVARGVRSG